MKEHNEDEQSSRQQQGNNGDERDRGDKSHAGATSTNPDKQRIQTVEANDIDETGTGDMGADSPRGIPNEDSANISNMAGEGADDDLFDQGAVRSAAFSDDRPTKDKDQKQERSDNA